MSQCYASRPEWLMDALHSLKMFSLDGVTKASASAVTALYKKTWSGRLRDFGDNPGKMCLPNQNPYGRYYNVSETPVDVPALQM